MMNDKFEFVKIYYRNDKQLRSESDIINYAEQNPDLINSIIADVKEGNCSRRLLDKLNRLRMEY